MDVGAFPKVKARTKFNNNSKSMGLNNSSDLGMTPEYNTGKMLS